MNRKSPPTGVSNARSMITKCIHVALMALGTLLASYFAKAADGVTAFAIDGGAYDSLALKSDGTVWSWGYNRFGEAGNAFYNTVSTNPVILNEGISNIVAIAAGGWDSPFYAHSLLLRSDGRVEALGNNTFGQLGDGSGHDQTNCVFVSGVSNVIAVAAGGCFSLALKSDGTVWSWGRNDQGQIGDGFTSSSQATPVQVTNLDHIIAISAGNAHAMALKSDGAVFAWGYNTDGQVGIGNTTSPQTRPVQTTNLSNVISISAGGYHSLALKGDGTVFSWGKNSYGELGNGNTTGQSSPVQATNLNDIVSIMGGGYHSLALKADGTVWGWGENNYGQIGVGNTTSPQKVPVQTTNLSGVISIGAGEYHSFAVFNDGTIAVWGFNNDGQLGNIVAKGSNLSSPGKMSDFSGVALGVNGHTVLGKTDGTVWGFGYNQFGQVGDGTIVNRSLSVNIASLVDIDAVFGGASHSVALQTNGKIWTWGDNKYGQLGDGSLIGKQTPVLVTDLNGIIGVGAGGEHTLAVKSDGTVWAWGNNLCGQLGNGTEVNDNSPLQTTGITNVSSIAAGLSHSLALETNGTVLAWGDNNYGQLGDGTFANRSTPVVTTNLPAMEKVCCGDNFSVGLSTNGVVYTWGDNHFGQLGVGNTNNSGIPLEVGGIDNVISVVAGGCHVLALKTDGTVWSWGRNAYGQLGIGSVDLSMVPVQIKALSGVVAIGAGKDDSFAVLADGEAMAWGDGQFGQLGNGNQDACVTLPMNVADFWQSQPNYVSGQQSAFARTGRFTRGTGTDPTYESFVVAYNSQQGVPMDNEGSMPDKYSAGHLPWFLRIDSPEQWHYSRIPTNGPTITNNGNIYFPFKNPIVAFGSQGGGSPLYTRKPTTFILSSGERNETNPLPDDIVIKVYRKADLDAGQTDVTNFASIDIPIPRVLDSNSWSQFAANGFQETVNAYGLKTDIRLLTGNDVWDGIYPYGVVGNTPYEVTHTAESSQYYYVVGVSGLIATNDTSAKLFGQTTNWMVLAASNTDYVRGWSSMYSLDFDEIPPWRTTMIDNPHFDGKPLPSAYLGKSPTELTNLTAQVTNDIDLSSSIYLALDQSPELRSHPILDDFVAQMKNDPIALANYVINQIQLTDGMAWPANGVPAPSSAVYLDGVNRSALDTFLEGEGSPIEQCSLLIYFLRKAGYPAAYMYPTNNNIELLDTTLSKLLHIQVKGAVDYLGRPFTTNSLITVNYPWVVTKINGKTTHIFPWLKDTEITEGLNVLDYMPSNYNGGFKWVKNYIFNDTNIVTDPLSNVPRILFPRFVKNMLKEYHPGLSLDDVGMQIRDRQHYYSRWQDFPVPNVVKNPLQSVVLDSLSSSAITNVSPGLTNIFDTVSVQVVSMSNTNHSIYTGNLRIMDVLNRRFLVFTNDGNLTLWLAPYRPDITDQSAFTNDPLLLNTEVLTVPNSSGEVNLNVNIVYKRDLNVGNHDGYHYDVGTGSTFLSQSAALSVGPGLIYNLPSRPLVNSAVAAICLNVGKVSQKMVDLHAQEYWQMERERAADTNLVVPIQDSKGTAAYLMGMSYYKNCSEGQVVIGNLLKQQVTSFFGAGLAKFRLYGTKIQPSVDMFFANTFRAGFGSMRPDQEQDFYQSDTEYNWIFDSELSAEEHNVINGFFSSTDAVSSVQLLQIAQKNSSPTKSGVIQLTSYNDGGLASTRALGYSTTLGSQGVWGETVAQINNGWLYAQFDPEATAFITPAPMSNASGSYTGSGALVVTKYNAAGYIDQNQLGGWGDDTYLFAPISSGGYNVSLIGGGSTPLSFAPWPPPIGSYLPNTISWSSAPDIGSAFSLTPAQNTGYQWADHLFFNPPGIDNVGLFNMSASIGNPGEVVSWKQLASAISDPVNPLTGAFHVDATDISLPGPMPLQLRRNYSSQNQSDLNGFGYGWKNAYLPYLTVVTNTASEETNLVIYAAEMDGSVLAYRQQAAPDTNTFIPVPQDNPTLCNNSGGGIGSTANLFNNRLVLEQSATNTIYKLYGVDGSVRTFVTNSFPLVSPTNTISRFRPYLARWQDSRGNYYDFFYGTNSDDTDYGQLNRVESSNGNFLELLYNTFGYITEVFTGDGRILHYKYDDYGDLVQVTLPDASQINYEYEHYNYSNGTTNHVDSNHLLSKQIKENGEELDNFYDDQRRVVVQMATVGDDLNTYTNAVFTYANDFQYTNSYTNTISGYTLLEDVNGNDVRYDYTNDLITKVTDQLGQTVQQSWYSDDATVPGYPHSLAQSVDKRGLITQYQYDDRGNATNVTLIGDLTGNGVTNEESVSHFVYNTNNLLLQVIDAATNSVVIAYNTNYPYLPSTLTLFAGDTPVSTNLLLYGDVSEIQTNGTTYYTNCAYGMLERKISAWGSPDAATNAWVYDGRGFVTAQIQYTATGGSSPNITNTFYYNSRGEMVQKEDQAGRIAEFQYDGMGRRTAKEIFDADGALPMYQEYSYYDGNGNLTWWDGPRSNPDDYIWRDYDGADRKIQETHWRSRAKSDGSGVEAETGDNLYATTFYQYDMYNDLVRVTDSYGNYTRMSYDAVGQMVKRERFGPNNMTPLSVESFAYEPGGEVSIYTNALGGITYKSYTSTGKVEQQTNSDGSILKTTYYLDGRPRREYLANGDYYETAYDDANRTVRRTFSADPAYLETRVFDRRGNLIIYTNAVGGVFTYAYDGADRLIQSFGPAATGTSAQQTTGYIYQDFGTTVTTTNDLGSTTVNYDALGRVTTNSVYDMAHHRIHVETVQYSPDFNSETTTLGSGSDSISTTRFTDTYGKTVLTQNFPVTGATNYTLDSFDVLENLVASRDELGQTNLYYYDPLNRLQEQMLPDGATIDFGYNAVGSLTNRIMPGGLTWSAAFDSANRMISEQLAGGAQVNRQFTYEYYTNGPDIGLLKSKYDARRSVASVASYDDFRRLATNSIVGLGADQDQLLSYQYDRQGQITNLTQVSGIAPDTTTTSVERSYDGYGQMTAESVLINGITQSHFTQNWNSTGQRSQLAQVGAGTGGLIDYDYQADGMLTNVLQAGQNYSFGYGDNGLLSSRVNPWRTVTTGLRDGEGRLLQVTNKLGSNNALLEAMSWRANSTLSSYDATRTGTGAWNDSRNYEYNARGQLTNEPVGISTGVSAAYDYGFDADKLGVLVSAQLSGDLTNGWEATDENSLGQVTAEQWTQSALNLRAGGSAVNASSVSATLDSAPVTANLDAGRWYADLSLSPGSHTLAATADYSVGSFSASATSTFTVNGTNTVTDYYDGAGYVTNRVFGSGKTQALTWDGLGRLTGVDEMDTPTNGFVWMAVYDGLGRRLRTVQTPVVDGMTNTAAALTLDSYYDPLVEFQELAVGINGQRTWKVMGPDLDGHYGGMNGVGGLEATIRESDGGVTAVLNDIFGNVLATVSGTTASWNPVRVGGYGPVYGYKAATLTGGTPLAETLVWRSRRMDPSGFYDLGTRYYDPVAGRFLSPDPLGNAGSMDLYSAFNGDPVNQFDPDGRFAAGSLNGALQYGSEVYASLGNALDAVVGSVVGVFNPGKAALNYGGGYQADSSYQNNYERGSAAYRAGSDFGYTAAFIGLQVGLVAATEGLGELAPVAGGARWMEEADSLEMGGGMALRSGEEAGTGIGSAGSLRNTFTPEGQGEFGFVGELDSAPARTEASTVSYQSEGGASQAEQLELNFGSGGNTTAGRLSSLELNQRINLRGAVAEQRDLLRSQLSGNQRGPVISGVMDKTTGDIFYGLNTEAIIELHPALTERVTSLEGLHSEVIGLNKALWARSAPANVDLSDFLIYNRRFSNNLNLAPSIPRCPTCQGVTRGAASLSDPYP